MPALNAEKTILLVVGSIQWQTYSNWELIVIDDGSTDNTLNLLRGLNEPRLRVYADGRHAGLSARLNKAVSLCHGKYIARMDADDIAYPDRLIRQLDYLTANPNVDVLGTAIIAFYGDGCIRGKRFRGLTSSWVYRYRLRSIPLAHPTLMARSEWFRLHPYYENASHFEDQ